MKTKTQTKWLGAAVVALLGLAAGRAEAGAGNASYLNIDVTITQTLSVAVGGLQTSTQAVTWNGQATLTNVTPMSVSNDSTYFASQWRFSTPTNSLDSTNGSAGWTIGAAAGHGPGRGAGGDRTDGAARRRARRRTGTSRRSRRRCRTRRR